MSWFVFVIDADGSEEKVNSEPYNDFQVAHLLATLKIADGCSLLLRPS